MVIGGVMAFAGTALPTGYLELDGSSHAAATYPALAAACPGWVVGADIVLPNMAGRTPVGRGTMTSGGSGTYNQGVLGGAEAHVLAVAEIPAHTHQYQKYATDHGDANGTDSSTPTSGTDEPVDTTSAGGGGGHNNMPPYLVVRYLVRAA